MRQSEWVGNKLRRVMRPGVQYYRLLSHVLSTTAACLRRGSRAFSYARKHALLEVPQDVVFPQDV
eukprot:16254283-Heterocapsa_arctica.AAC.1